MIPWRLVGAVVLAVGTVPPLFQAVVDPDRREFYGVLSGVTGIAALAYLAMGLGVGDVTTAGRAWNVVRYADWLVTTPLIVLYLAMLSQPTRATYLRLVAADVVMILAGASANVLPGPFHLVAFGVGGAAFAYLVYVLWLRLGVESSVESQGRQALFEKLRNVTIVLWGVYPAVWLLSTKGVGLLLPVTETVVIVYLDVLTKAAFVVVAVNGSDAIDPDAATAEAIFDD